MPIARAELTDRLPGGRAVVRLEREGEIVLRFAEGHLSPQGRAELTELMQAGLDSGAWIQNWGGRTEPPQPSAN